jgi:molecular chaperone DnaK (HSP70)
MRLGIDFGTTRTVVAAAVDGRYPVVVFETAKGFSDFVPGLAVRNGSKLELGWAATQGLTQRTEGAVRSIKRAISSRYPDDPLAELDCTTTALDLVHQYLTALRRLLLQSANLEISPDEPFEAMIAVPANASTRQRYLTVEAFTRAGFTVLGMVNEPTAAAIEYAYNNIAGLGRRSPKRYVVVYDLGGGTFDTSAVSLADRRFELIATEGIGELGGEDFDEAILKLTLAEAGKVASDLTAVERARALELCREAKETLTPSSKRLLVDLSEVGAGLEPVTLDLGRLYAETQPLVARTLSELDSIFDQVRGFGIDPENPRELGAVYLVGGATAFPLVTRTLRERYGRKVMLAPQPHAATAVGLAIAADPDSGIFVREAATRHFGVWREGERGREKIFDRIISKGSLPEDGRLHIERRYRPVHAVGHLRYLECSGLGSGGEPAGDLTPWGDILFPYDPALADVPDLSAVEPARRLPGEHEEIKESYTYRSDGTIAVRIENLTRGYARGYVLGQQRFAAAE